MSSKQKSTKTFFIEEVDEDGTEFSGRFTVKRMTVADLQKLGIRKTQLNGGFYTVRDEFGEPTGRGLDPGVDQMNEMIAHCEVALLQKPDWFDSERLFGTKVLRAVYSEVIDHEASFRQRGGSSSGGEEGSEEESERESRDAIPTEAVVDKEVPTIRKKR